MYLKRVNIENYGSIEKINYELPFREDGNPKPVIIIGKNGSGKTLLVSNIVHAIIELKKKAYNDIPETDEVSFYKVDSKQYIKNGKSYSYINYQFSDNIRLVDLTTNNYEKIKDKEFLDVNINDNGLKNDGFYQKLNTNNYNDFQLQKIFADNITMYLPVDRYYSPNWLNVDNPKIEFNSNYQKYLGKTKVNIIKSNLLNEIESWILDVIIDEKLYEQTTIKTIEEVDGKTVEKDVVKCKGRNTCIHECINKIITTFLKAGNDKIENARIGITMKNNRRIGIIYSIDGIEYEYVPKFSNLSSGEVMILGMTAAILKEYDRVNNSEDFNIEEAQGIVVIDEIDAHLHFDFCRNVLPEMMKIFPKIQFIITSHSPFFLLGMKEKFKDDCEFLNMPSGLLNNIDNYEDIKKMYELIESDYSEKIEKIKKYEKIILKIQKPLVITEGKTDWKHLKNALSEFKKIGKFNDLDVDFLEYEDTMGDGELEILLKKYSMVHHDKKIIGLFDSDEVTGEKYDKDTWKEFGNNVYGWSIGNPRNLPYGISIEFLYNDDDIKLTDVNGKRLYLTDEFKEKNCQCKQNPLIVTIKKNYVSTYYKNGQVKILEGNEVLDENENPIALSKSEFANNIYNKVEPFVDVDISNFEPVFERIRKILNS